MFWPYTEQTFMTVQLVQTVVRVHEVIHALAELVSVDLGHPGSASVNGLDQNVIGIADPPQNYIDMFRAGAVVMGADLDGQALQCVRDVVRSDGLYPARKLCPSVRGLLQPVQGQRICSRRRHSMTLKPKTHMAPERIQC